MIEVEKIERDDFTATIYVDKDPMSPEEWDTISKEWMLNALESEANTWGQYGEGDVYGFVISDSENEHLDSCWGFYGIDHVTEGATAALDHCIKESRAEDAPDIEAGMRVK